MGELRDMIGRELERIEPLPGGLDATLRRVLRRRSRRRVAAGVLGLGLVVALAAGLWAALPGGGPSPISSTGPPTSVSPSTSAPGHAGTSLYLAGDGELWVVDISRLEVRHIDMRELSPGDPPHRIVARDGRLVAWGYKTYVLDPGHEDHPRVLVDDSLFFLPSAAEDRVWAVIPKGDDPGTGLPVRAVREITVDGEVTVPDSTLPPGAWPEAAVGEFILFSRPRLEDIAVWDPRTGSVVRTLPGDGSSLGGGSLVAWRSGDGERST
jgi:hypothetical protein